MAVVGLAVGLASGPANAAAPVGIYSGNAYATSGSVTVGPLAASLGPTAYVDCPCLGTNGQISSSSLAAATAGPNGDVFSTGGLLSTIETSSTSTRVTNESVSKIVGFNAFKGLVTADAIIAVSRTVATATHVRSDDVGTSFANLRIAGQPIQADVSPNTVIALPGLGSITLKQQSGTVSGSNSASLTMNMIAVKILEANSFGLPVGATITIGHSASGFKRGVPSVIYSGRAYATLALTRLDSQLSAGSGMTALVQAGCAGTNGATKKSSIEEASILKLLTVGTGVTTATAGSGVTKTTSSIGKISLLNGLITANGVNAVAQMSLIGGRRVSSTTGSGVAGLRVLGLPVPVSVAPNTKINLPGIGFVVVNEQTIPAATSSGAVTVSGLRIVVSQTNLLNLPIGANIVVGYAAARVTKAGG